MCPAKGTGVGSQDQKQDWVFWYQFKLWRREKLDLQDYLIRNACAREGNQVSWAAFSPPPLPPPHRPAYQDRKVLCCWHTPSISPESPVSFSTGSISPLPLPFCWHSVGSKLNIGHKGLSAHSLQLQRMPSLNAVFTKYFRKFPFSVIFHSHTVDWEI